MSILERCENALLDRYLSSVDCLCSDDCDCDRCPDCLREDDDDRDYEREAEDQADRRMARLEAFDD